MGIYLGLVHTNEIQDPAVVAELEQLVASLQAVFNVNQDALASTSTTAGFAPSSPGDATKFLNGAATPAYAKVKDSDLSVNDVSANNVTTGHHGFAPKAPGNVNFVLTGTPGYGIPAGTSGVQRTQFDQAFMGGL